MTFYFKVRNDITVSTLTRIVTAMRQYLRAEGYRLDVVAVINDVKDLRLILDDYPEISCPDLPDEIWKGLIDVVDQGVESMPRNGIVLVEEESE